MGEKITLDLQERDVRGSKVSKLRKEGILPAIVYGSGMEPVMVMAPANLIEKVCKDAGRNHPVHLTIGKTRKMAMIKDIDIDPAKRRIRHVSFHAVKQNETVEAAIPIKLVGEGESAAEKAGLVVLQNLESITVKALPMALPEALEVSIVDLSEAGQHLKVSDLTLPKGVELVDIENPDEVVIVNVYEPGALQAANNATGGEGNPDDVSEVDAINGGDTDDSAQNSAANTDHKQQ